MKLPEGLASFLETAGKVLQYELFDLNQTPITPASIVMFLLVVLAFYIAARIIDRALLRRILPRFQIDEGMRYNLKRISHYIIMVVGLVVAFQFVGIDLSGLAVIFGLLVATFLTLFAVPCLYSLLLYRRPKRRRRPKKPTIKDLEEVVY